MVTFISSALFALSASLDAFLAGMTLGFRRIRIPLRHNLIISLITLAGTVLSFCLGGSLAPLLPGRTSFPAGSLLLILTGTYYLIKFMLQTIKKYHPRTGKSKDRRQDIPLRSSGLQNTLILGAALSINNIGIGVSAGIAGIAFLPSAILTFLFSALFLALGGRLGRIKLFRHLQGCAELITGLMLILLGFL